MKVYVLMWSDSIGYDCDCNFFGVTTSLKAAKLWSELEKHYDSHWYYEGELNEQTTEGRTGSVNSRID